MKCVMRMTLGGPRRDRPGPMVLTFATRHRLAALGRALNGAIRFPVGTLGGAQAAAGRCPTCQRRLVGPLRLMEAVGHHEDSGRCFLESLPRVPFGRARQASSRWT